MNTYEITASAEFPVDDNLSLSVSVGASGDVLVPYTMPEAEYMYGCSSTALGMILGYYDLYGYLGYDVSDIIPGTVEVSSRGTDGNIYNMNAFDTVLGNFIASEGYVDRFYRTTPAEELPYTFIDGDPQKGLNTAAWDSLSDYLGTGQYWRANIDTSTRVITLTLRAISNSTTTVTISSGNLSLQVPYKYLDMKYGLSLYVESVGYNLDPDQTKTVQADSSGGSFTFANFMAEIDIGRPMLITMTTTSNYGHMVTAYGYNASTQSIIFDDTYKSNCTMKWNGTYLYSGDLYSISTVTTIVLDTLSLPLMTAAGNTVKLYSGNSLVSSASVMTGATVSSSMTQYVSSGGVARNTAVLSGGRQYIYSNGVASSTTVHSGGSMLLNSGGNAYDLTLGNYGSASIYGNISGAKVSSQGILQLYNAASISNAEVLSGGRLYLKNGASGGNITVNRGGVMVVNSSGTLTGNLTMAGLLKLDTLVPGTLNGGGKTITLDIQERHASDPYMIDDLSQISNVNISVKVSATQSSGTYLLAAEATGFTGSVSLCVGSGSCSTLSVGGSKTSGNLTCSLKIDSGVLSLTVQNINSGTAPAVSDYVPGTWSTDWTQASTYARENNLPIFAYFGDKTLCGFCGYMNDYLFAAEDFKELSKSMVLLYDTPVPGKTYNGSPAGYLLDAAGNTLAVRYGFGSSAHDSWMTWLKINLNQATGVYSYSSEQDFVQLGSNVAGTSISSGYTVYVNSATLTSGTIFSGGSMLVNKAGKANNTKIQSGGRQYVNSGGIASAAVIAAGGSMIINNGGEAHTTQINSSGRQYVSSGGVASATTLNSGGYMAVYNGGITRSAQVKSGGNQSIQSGGAAVGTTVSSGGIMYITSGGCHSGTLNITSGALVSAYVGAIIDFTVAERKATDSALVNNFALIRGAANASYFITVKAGQENGTYKLAANASTYNYSTTLKNTDGTALGTLAAGGSITSGGYTYKLTLNSGTLSLNITGSATPPTPTTTVPNTNLTDNGYSQIVAWDAARGKVGYVATNGQTAPAWRGIWEWSGSEASMWKVVGVGQFSSSVEHDGILLYNGYGNTFAAWTDLGRGDYGYVSLCHVEGNFQTKTLADFDGNGLDDVIIYDEKGSFGIVSDARTYHDVWHVDNAATNVQKLIGAGYFGNADGMSEILVKKTDENAYFLWHNEDPTFKTWNWTQTYIGTLDNDWEVAAIGDFQGDGIDDIIMWQKSTGYIYAWEDGKSSNQRWVGQLDSNKWEIAAVGDYNGDGKEDLLLRELSSGWGGVGYWASANASNWTDLNARIETDMESKFAVIA